MPMLQLMRCPICQEESEPGTTPPRGWINVGIPQGGSETFDTWRCLRRYAANRVAADDAEEAAAAAPEVQEQEQEQDETPGI